MNSNHLLDFFIRQTAKATLTSEDIVEKVIRSQWKYANEASHNYKEVEFSEIGIFYPSPKKVITRLAQLSNKINYITQHNHNTNRSNKILEDAKHTYNDLKGKTNDIIKRYMEKQERYTGRSI